MEEHRTAQCSARQPVLRLLPPVRAVAPRLRMDAAARLAEPLRLVVAPAIVLGRGRWQPRVPPLPMPTHLLRPQPQPPRVAITWRSRGGSHPSLRVAAWAVVRQGAAAPAARAERTAGASSLWMLPHGCTIGTLAHSSSHALAHAPRASALRRRTNRGGRLQIARAGAR
jgi:hypothetical protein